MLLNVKRHGELIGALKLGATVICLLEPLDLGNVGNFAISNYDWLFSDYLEMTKELGTLEESIGYTIDWIDKSSSFFEYLSKVKRWNAYFQINKVNQKIWKIIAKAFNTHAIALTRRYENGHIILLPSYIDRDMGELLISGIGELRIERTTAPEWLKTYYVPGQQEALTVIAELDQNIADLNEKRQIEINKYDSLEPWKWLLYEKGVIRLQKVVEDAFKLLDCTVEPTVSVDSDGKVTCTLNGDALLEVEGRKDAIKIEKISQLMRNQADYAQQNQVPIKGILVGNPFCEEVPENRPPKDSQKLNFTKELIKLAETQHISVIWTVDLFKLVCKLINETDENKKLKLIECVKHEIFEGAGLINFSILS